MAIEKTSKTMVLHQPRALEFQRKTKIAILWHGQATQDEQLKKNKK